VLQPLLKDSGKGLKMKTFEEAFASIPKPFIKTFAYECYRDGAKAMYNCLVKKKKKKIKSQKGNKNGSLFS